VSAATPVAPVTPPAPAAPSLRERVSVLRRSTGVRRLVACLLSALVAALVTGPPGQNNALVAGFTGSWLHPRVLLFLALGLALWGLFEAGERLRGPARTVTGKATALRRMLLGTRPRRFVAYIALLGFAIAYPPALSPYWQQVLVSQIGIYVLLAMGLNVVVGFAGLLDLGYIAFFAIGAYSDAYWSGSLPVHPPFHLNPFWILPFAVAAAMVAGVILGAPTLRLRGDYLAIVTLGFGEIIQIVAVNMTSITGGSVGVVGVPHFSVGLFGVHYVWGLGALPYYYLLLAFVVAAFAAFHLLEDSRVGRAWTALREDEVAAEASGINALKYKILAFAIGASTSGLAGVLFASKNNFMDPTSFSFTNSVLVLVLVIFGGMGGLIGPMVGAAVLQWLPQFLRGRIPPTDLFIYFGALLIVLMIFRPQGLIPSRRRQREIALAEEGIISADALGSPGAAP
jgi:branched-chain amino acid transport system permease protein